MTKVSHIDKKYAIVAHLNTASDIDISDEVDADLDTYICMETCRSGLTYLFAKEAGSYIPRRFESSRLRINKNTKRFFS